MKVFKLLILSALRIFSKSKILIIQLMVLVILGASVLGTISLSNISLKSSADNIEKNGNSADLTINSTQTNDNVVYDIDNQPLADQNGWDNKQPVAGQAMYVFNPLMTSHLYRSASTNEKPTLSDVQGFYYTPGVGANGLIKDNNGSYLSVNATGNNADQWLPYAQDIFSLYRNVLPVNQNDILYSTAQYYDPNNYITNPYSFVYNPDGQLLGLSAFGAARVAGFTNYTNQYTVSHGVLDAQYGYVAGTNFNFPNWLKQPSDAAQIQPVTINLLASPSQLIFPTQLMTEANYESVANPNLAYFISKYGNQQMINDFNHVTSLLQSPNALMQVPYYTFNYDLIPNRNLNDSPTSNETANNLVNFVYSKIFNNGVIMPEYQQYLKYFVGSIQVPAIPYYTVEQTNTSSSSTYTMLADNVENVLSNALQTLSKQLVSDVIPAIFSNQPNLETEYNDQYSLTDELNKLGFSYNYEENVNLSNPINGNQYVVAKATLPTIQNPDPINKIVLNEGSNLFPDQIVENASPYTNGNLFIGKMLQPFLSSHFAPPTQQYLQEAWNFWNQYQSWNLFKALMSAEWQTKESVVELAMSLLQPLSTRPTSYSQFVNETIPAFMTFSKNFILQNFTWNGYGFTIQTSQAIPASNGSIFIPFDVTAVDKSSFFSIISTNFMKSNSSTKAVLPVAIAQAAMQLPYSDPTLTQAQVNANPAKYSNHFIIDPTTHKLTYYQDFLSWMAKISDRYKIEVNSQSYVILGSGLSPDFMYPILSKNDLLLNNKTTGVIYTNSAGFNRSIFGLSAKVNSYVALKYSPSVYWWQKQKLFNELSAFTKKVYGSNQLYKITDPNQPNQLLYLRMNFSYNLRSMVLAITVIIGIIIALLSLFFIATLLRSIVKQNKNTFGVVIANGINKEKLAVAFFPFAIFPGILCGVLGYLFSYLLAPSLTGMVANYWAPIIPESHWQGWMFVVTPALVCVILFVVLILVILWTIRKKTTELLGESSEFRMNWFIMHINKLTTHFGALGSFRITYMLGNITRFLVLTGIVTAFITLSSIFVGTIGTFQSALSYTKRNHQYTYAFNLYSPTQQGGYYSAIPISQVGTTQQGLDPLYNIADNNGFYGAQYKQALTYPYANDLYYTNLFLPSTNVASEIQGNIQFFKNSVFTKIDLDINLSLGGTIINPWSFAKSFAPPAIISLSNFYMQKLLDNAFQFFLYVQQNNLYQEFSNDTFNQPWTLNGSDIQEPIMQSQNDNWIYLQRYTPNGQLEWYLNPNDLVGAPTYQFNKRAVKLFVDLLTINENPLYRKWAMAKFGVVNNYNYSLGNNVVAMDPGDETYTYLTSTITDVNNKQLEKPISVQIDGIKPNTNFVLLYDNKGSTLNQLLNQAPTQVNGVTTYPLVINQVVQRKYNLKVGDVFTTHTTNQLDRFTIKYNDPTGIDYVTSQFKIVGITTSKSGLAYYTNQRYANEILGYSTPDWLNKQQAEAYVPFNGLFTDSNDPAMINQFGTVYSPTGLSPAIGLWSKNPSQVAGGMEYQIFRSWDLLNKIVGFDVTKGLKNYTLGGAVGVLSRLIDTFNITTPIVVAIQSASTRLETTIMGNTIDETVKNVMSFITAALIPTLVIVIILLSSMIVVEARRLIALLKVLGYGNFSNTFSFLFVYLVVLFAGLGISIGLTYLILYIFSYLTFSVFNIIIAPVAPWWIYAATFGVVALIFIVIFIATYLQLKKINPAQAIAVR